jgi:hypothetical protein
VPAGGRPVCLSGDLADRPGLVDVRVLRMIEAALRQPIGSRRDAAPRVGRRSCRSDRALDRNAATYQVGESMRGWLIMRMIAIVLLAAGVLALVYGGFSYTRQTHDAKLGPLEISVSEKQRVNVPVWAGVVLVAAGAGLLLTQKK